MSHNHHIVRSKQNKQHILQNLVSGTRDQLHVFRLEKTWINLSAFRPFSLRYSNEVMKTLGSKFVIGIFTSDWAEVRSKWSNKWNFKVQTPIHRTSVASIMFLEKV